MIENLPLFHRLAGQPVIVLGHGEAATTKRRLVRRAGAEPIDTIAEGIDRGARLAFVAHDDAEAARADALRLRCAGLLVNAADRPELCDFTVPSLLDRSPVLIAIGTGGASAGLAKQLRLRLEALLPQSLGRLAQALFDARPQMRERWPDARDRRRALDAALATGGALDPLSDESADAVPVWLSGDTDAQDDSAFEIVLAGADPDDLTFRQARAMGSADTVVHEPEVPDAILDRARADAPRVRIEKGGAAPALPGFTVVMRFPARDANR